MLDPKDWKAFRALAHRAVDAAIDRLEKIRDEKTWQPAPKRAVQPLPRLPTALEKVHEEFLEHIAPYSSGNIHPRFFGWVQGSGTATGALADFLAAMINPNMGGRDHGAIEVERQVIEWSKEMFGLPKAASGVLTTGTSQANFIAVLVARCRALGLTVRSRGPGGAKLVAYASSAAHNSLARAFDFAGLGSDALRLLPADVDARLDPAALANAIRADRENGNEPFMVIGTAGTVDTGAIDPLNALADVAHENGLWFHVDGAFGATAILAASVAPRLVGIERADSIAFDFHKWLHVPYDAGCILVRDADQHRAAFATAPHYLKRAARGISGGEPWFTDFTTDLSRGFRALKVWFTLKEFGTEQLAQAIEKNLRQAQLLGRLIEANAHFELLAPVVLNIVCFRYKAGDAFNEDLIVRLQESGVAVTSSTLIGGQLAIRVNLTNHRTRDEDMVILLETIAALAEASA